MLKKMVWLFIVLFLIAIYTPLAVKAFQMEESDSEPDFISMEATAYQYGTTRFDGGKVRTGICAAKPDWYGKVAAVYEDDCGAPGEFIGYFECLDTGGDERIKNGTCIDIYHPDKDWCIKFGRKKVLVLLIDGEG